MQYYCKNAEKRHTIKLVILMKYLTVGKNHVDIFLPVAA